MPSLLLQDQLEKIHRDTKREMDKIKQEAKEKRRQLQLEIQAQRKEIRAQTKALKKLRRQFVKEDLLRRKKAQQHLGRLIQTDYWDDEVNQEYIRHREVENPIRLITEKRHYKRYRIINLFATTIEEFLTTVKSKVMSILSIHNKVVYTLKITMTRYDNEKQKWEDYEHFLVKPAYTLVVEEDLENSYKDLIEYYNTRLAEFMARNIEQYSVKHAQKI